MGLVRLNIFYCNRTGQSKYFYWDLTGLTTYHWDLTGLTTSHWDLTGLTNSHWGLTGLTTSHWDLTRLSTSHWDLTGLTSHWDLTGLTTVYLVLIGVTSDWTDNLTGTCDCLFVLLLYVQSQQLRSRLTFDHTAKVAHIGVNILEYGFLRNHQADFM